MFNPEYEKLLENRRNEIEILLKLSSQRSSKSLSELRANLPPNNDLTLQEFALSVEALIKNISDYDWLRLLINAGLPPEQIFSLFEAKDQINRNRRDYFIDNPG